MPGLRRCDSFRKLSCGRLSRCTKTTSVAGSSAGACFYLIARENEMLTADRTYKFNHSLKVAPREITIALVPNLIDLIAERLDVVRVESKVI